MPANPKGAGHVYQPRFRGDSAVRSLTLWPHRASTPGVLDESAIYGGTEINWTGIEKRRLFAVEDDFDRKPGAALLAPFHYTEASVSTNAAGDFDADAAGGTYSLTHSADSEGQTMRVDFDDNRTIDTTRPWFFECRAKINFAGATFSADQRAVFGVCSDYNATLDSTTVNAWFRVEGANLNILCEADDNTTNTDDVDSTADIVDNTFVVLRIEGTSAGALDYYVNGTKVTSTGCTWAAVSGTVQPIVCIQRDAGTEAEVLTIDYIRVGYLRA